MAEERGARSQSVQTVPRAVVSALLTEVVSGAAYKAASIARKVAAFASHMVAAHVVESPIASGLHILTSYVRSTLKRVPWRKRGGTSHPAPVLGWHLFQPPWISNLGLFWAALDTYSSRLLSKRPNTFLRRLMDGPGIWETRQAAFTKRDPRQNYNFIPE